MIVYIDANKYLDFLRNAAEDFTSLNLLAKHMKKENITLLFPQITQDEFHRNLDNVRFTYMTSTSLVPLKLSIPQQSSLNKDQKLRSKIKKHVDAINEEISKLKIVYTKKSDDLVKQIERLANLADSPDTDSELFSRAKKRRLTGNPPGKSDSKFHIGDEIVWEIILRDYTNDDVVIISADSDWTNASERDLSNRTISTFLAREWAKKSNKTLALETNIGKFINDNFKVTSDKVPEDEIKKEDTIDQSSFTTTPLAPSSSVASATLSGWDSQNWGQPWGGWESPTLVAPHLLSDTPVTNMIISSGLNTDRHLVLGYWSCPKCNTQNSNNSSMCIECRLNRSQYII